MTRIIIKELENGVDISITGHAEKVNEGKENLLCCAVSVLGQTLAQAAIDMETEGKAKASVRIESGLIRVKVQCKKGARQELREKVRVIETGFELLKAEYPEQIFMAGAISF